MRRLHWRWSLRQYMAFVAAALIVVAAAAEFFVRVQLEQEARQAAAADSRFAAQKAVKQLDGGFAVIQALSVPLASGAALVPAFLDPKKCGIGYAPIAAFATGHIDLVRLDGSVVCSSSKPANAGTDRLYQGQAWLLASRPVVVAPILDAATGNEVAVVAYPVAGYGLLVWFLDLAPIGLQLESEYGSGVHQLEFLIIGSDGLTVVARSIDPAQWVGKTVDVASFGSPSAAGSRPDLNGTQRIYDHATVDAAGWRLYVGADEASALAIADLLATRLLAIVLSGLAVVLVVMLVVVRRITEPMVDLNRRVRLGPAGGPRSSTRPKGAAEIAALSDDFDRLMATVNADLAARRANEQAALVSERNYRMLFEGHPQPMWLYDSETLAFLKVNDAAVTQYGYSREEFLAMTIRDIWSPQDVLKLEMMLSRGLPPFDRNGPWQQVRKDGSSVEVLITSHALAFGDRAARFVLAEDLTASRRLELELMQSKARAESSAELSRTKDEMMSMVSHEMRTPLASMVGFTELLATREVLPADRKEYLRIMLQEGRRLTAMINDFLDLRRIEGGHLTMHPEPADLGMLIKRAIALLGDPASPIETRLPHDLPLARIDSDSIFQVMANLLSNALKYSPAGGEIVVGASVADGMVEISVQDHGLGIPAEALPHVFGRFYRVNTPDRQAIRGTGLGLAISKGIVEAHGGRIGVRSEGLGKGATFFFTVPAYRQVAQAGDVLLVEDDSGFAHLLEAELTARNLSSVWAADAEAAEQLMTKLAARAVVLDLLLPGLSGQDFLRRLRDSRGSDLLVVVVTMKDVDAVEAASLQALGVTAVLRKGSGTAATAANLIASSLERQLVAT